MKFLISHRSKPGLPASSLLLSGFFFGAFLTRYPSGCLHGCLRYRVSVQRTNKVLYYFPAWGDEFPRKNQNEHKISVRT